MGKLESLGIAYRVTFPGGYSVLIIPDPQKGESHKDFYLTHDATGTCVFMFGCNASQEESLILAENNYKNYTDDL